VTITTADNTPHARPADVACLPRPPVNFRFGCGEIDRRAAGVAAAARAGVLIVRDMGNQMSPMSADGGGN